MILGKFDFIQQNFSCQNVKYCKVGALFAECQNEIAYLVSVEDIAGVVVRGLTSKAGKASGRLLPGETI